VVRDQERAGLEMVALWLGCDKEMCREQTEILQFPSIAQSHKNINASYAT